MTATCKLDSISVLDDLLPPDLQIQVLKVLQQPCWSIGKLPIIKGDDKPPAKLWHMNRLEDQPLFSQDIFRSICELFDTQFVIRRIYANGQLACQKGDIHKDSEDDAHFTFVYYPLQEWRREWGGNLMFYEGGEVNKCVSYVPNRAISFPAKVTHGAEATSKDYEGMRVSVAWKLQIPPPAPPQNRWATEPIHQVVRPACFW
jgi:hypothetical protein